MNIQPLVDLKGRLETAAIAGVGLLGEDFRLKRAAEGLKPLAAASPVFAKLEQSLQHLFTAPLEERGGELLDVLALTDAILYTQAAVGRKGELISLSRKEGVYQELSYNQLHPLLDALTGSGGGRIGPVQDAWENHKEFFQDYRVLPKVIDGLGESYADLADLNCTILKAQGLKIIPRLKEGFDPAGKKEMARRVQIIAELEGIKATPWLREILPQAKKDVAAAVILALGNDPANVPLLLELAVAERGKTREAVLQALVIQDGEAVREFWQTELKKHSGSINFLQYTNEDWASDLVAAGFREHLEKLLAKDGPVPAAEQNEVAQWCYVIGKKLSPAMLEFWHWVDEHIKALDRLANEKNDPIFIGVRLTDTLQECMLKTGPGPLREFCLTLWERRPEMTRYLKISFLAAVLSSPTAEVYEKFAPCILTEMPTEDVEYKKTLNSVLLLALENVWWSASQNEYRVYGGQSAAEPLDNRWIQRLISAVYDKRPKRSSTTFVYYWENVSPLDMTLMKLANPTDEETCRLLIPYLRKKLEETNVIYHYSRWLLQLGGSPKGLLGNAMKKSPKSTPLYYVWGLMHEASKVLPVEEVIELLKEIPVHTDVRTKLGKVIPETIEQMEAGNPFPEWETWARWA